MRRSTASYRAITIRICCSSPLRSRLAICASPIAEEYLTNDSLCQETRRDFLHNLTGSSRIGAMSGLRERKKTETRYALMVAALRLFAERGFDAVTTEDIAEAANVSPRTFFRYFETKADAVLGFAPARIAILQEHLATYPGTVLEATAAFFERLADE